MEKATFRTADLTASAKATASPTARATLAVAAVLAGVVSVGSAGAPERPAPGAIRGRVEVRLPPPVERRPEVSTLGASRPRDLPDLRHSVVYLESAPRGAFEQSRPGRAVMDQRNETFVPHVLAITTGTTVDFPNSDSIYHNVFSLSKARQFDLGRYATGRSRAVRFDQPGIVRVFCEIHSHMNAFILVFSHPFFAVTDADGRFRIDNVPAGSYGLVAWHEGSSSPPVPVTVADGGVADVEFDLR